MKKLIPLAVGVLAIACLPTTPIPSVTTPTASIESTPTFVPTLTETLLPSETPVLLNPSETPVVESPVVESPAAESTATTVDLPNLTSTIVTSTDVPESSSNTATPTPAPLQATLTPTLGILKYGTLPPAVPFNSITLWNRSKRQAYISLQVTTVEGYYTIIEYPVEGQIKIKAPLGSYLYVAWVGGNKMTGTFRLTSTDSLVITLFKDKVTVK